MKFITEYDLKYQYQQQPFETYTLTPDQRLTPEARQFLADRRVTLDTNKPQVQPAAPKALAQAEPSKKQPHQDADQKLTVLINFTQLDLYETALVCKPLDMALSQKLFALADSLADKAQQVAAHQVKPANLIAPNTFKLTYLYALSKYGPVMLKLARLGNELLLLSDRLAPEPNELIQVLLAELAKLIEQLKHKEE
ncbi:hypothetical protein ACFQ5J_13865 [Lacticaseibacillus baoqingensis]|uniref:Uncharacterized protein n=1 Tax=Lacticaseibacillus baoqingensis TaxID=2486013 RepID=A0ABW4E9E9_9LACO|nr:hypothetical protein [Lacticaseibacillus baoqingensis]